MTTASENPALQGRPIILVHLSMSAAEGLTTCSGVPFRAAKDDEYPHVPRVLCEACRRVHDRIRAALAHHLDAESDPCQDRGVDWPCDVAAALQSHG